MKQSLKHAYDKSPVLSPTLRRNGRVHPDDLKTLADLSKFPFTTKRDLRDTYPFGMFAVPQDKLARIHGSSGTTGKPTVVGYTKGDIDIWADLVARSIRAAGGRPGDMLHNAYGYGLFTGGLGAHYGAERLGCTVVPISGGMTERQVTLINDFKPSVIMVTPFLHAVDPGRVPPPGAGPARILAEGRHLRRRAVDQRHAAGDRGQPSTCTPSTSTVCPRSWGQASRRNASKPKTACTSGKTIFIPRSSIL
jgi:hypothetical protein